MHYTLQITDQNESILAAHELDDPKIVVRFTADESYYFPLQTIQTDSGAHSASYSIGTGSPFPVSTAAMS
jgi:hypothetical protein